MNKDSTNILSCEHVSKEYHDAGRLIKVLDGIDFKVDRGERVAIIGPSGSGKSTLLHLLGGIDFPSKGKVMINQQPWKSLSEKQRCEQRNRYLGFIYQFHHLLPEFTALENTALPLVLSGLSVESAQQQAEDMLDKVGLKSRLTHKPSQLSGGERQRVAIARALVNNPHCILADEPTGNLDHSKANEIVDLMLSLNQASDTALVIVTHDAQLASRMDTVMVLQDAQLKVQL